MIGFLKNEPKFPNKLDKNTAPYIAYKFDNSKSEKKENKKYADGITIFDPVTKSWKEVSGVMNNIVNIYNKGEEFTGDTYESITRGAKEVRQGVEKVKKTAKNSKNILRKN